jgi:hypothetical protein
MELETNLYYSPGIVYSLCLINHYTHGPLLIFNELK